MWLLCWRFWAMTGWSLRATHQDKTRSSIVLRLIIVEISQRTYHSCVGHFLPACPISPFKWWFGLLLLWVMILLRLHSMLHDA